MLLPKNTVRILLVTFCFLALLSCGSDGGKSTKPQNGTPQTLHFQLSQNEFLSEKEDYVVRLGGHEYKLIHHDAASKEKFGALFGSLEVVSHPTHYIEGLVLPDDRPMRIHVVQKSDRDGQLARRHGAGTKEGMAMVIIHFPTKAIARAVSSPVARHNLYLSKGLRRDYIDKLESAMTIRGSGALDPTAMNTYTPKDIAASILFHHPELLNVDPTAGANIMHNHIYQAAGLTALTNAIQKAGQHGWYSVVPAVDENQQPIKDNSGNPIVNYVIANSVQLAATQALTSALTSTKNDPTLTGQTYHPQSDPGSVIQSPSSSKRALKESASYTFDLGQSGYHYGLQSKVEYSGSTVTLTMNNNYVRHLSAFIQFYDENDKLVTPSPWKTLMNGFSSTVSSFIENDTTKFIGLLPPVEMIAGIPLGGSTSEAEVKFDWPMNARYAKIVGGGLGNGGPHEARMVAMGATCTSIFELAIPTILLASSVAEATGTAEMLTKIGKDTEIVSSILEPVINLIWGHGSDKLGDLLTELETMMVNLVWKNESVREVIIEAVAESELTEALPFVGWGLQALNIASTVAALTQTTVEVIESPWQITNTLTPVHDIHVTIKRDPADYQFPATATKYVVIASFSASDSQTMNMTLPVDPNTGLPTTVSEPQNVVFNDVPAGGNMEMAVYFYSATGWLAGQAVVKNIANQNDAGADYQSVTLTITENEVPLSDQSIYTHKVVLNYDSAATGQKYSWKGTTTPPSEVYLDLSSDTTGNTLASVVGATVNQPGGFIGYVFRSYAPSMTACPGNAAGGPLYFIKNTNLAQNPETGMLTTACGYSDQPFLLYDLTGDPATGLHFVIEPKGGSYFARPQSISGSNGVLTLNAQSYGIFPSRVDGLLYHPSGKLLAINTSYSKFFQLDLSGGLVDDGVAPVATTLAGPATSLAGLNANDALLRHPVALHLTPDKTVMVLDDISDLTAGTTTNPVRARLRAFSVDGTPVTYFAGGESSLDLTANPVDATLTITFLDFGFETQGYIYVLSYAVPNGSSGYTVSAKDYRLDLYKPDGTFLVRTPGLAAARMAVDAWRNLFAVNYQILKNKDTLTEPTISEWIPPTPKGK